MRILPFLLLVTTVFACAQPSPVTGRTKDGPIDQIVTRNIGPQEFSSILSDHPEVQIVDVRTPQETAAGIISGARLMDIYDPAFRQMASSLDPNKPVLLYCRSGNRSGQAMGLLSTMGFRELYNLQGGMMAWQASGLPVSPPAR